MTDNLDEAQLMSEQEVLLELSFTNADIKNSEAFIKDLLQDIVTATSEDRRSKLQQDLAQCERWLEEQKTYRQFWLDQLNLTGVKA